MLLINRVTEVDLEKPARQKSLREHQKIGSKITIENVEGHTAVQSNKKCVQGKVSSGKASIATNQNTTSSAPNSQDRTVQLLSKSRRQSFCQHSELIKVDIRGGGESNQKNVQQACCRECGCFISQSTGISALKQKSQYFEVDVAPIDIHQGLLEEEREFLNKELEEGGGCSILSIEDLRGLEELRNGLVDKISLLVERMSLSKLTLHTACAYIDRLVATQHVDELQEQQMSVNEILRKSGSKGPNIGAILGEPKKVITPRQRIVLSSKQDNPKSSSLSSRHKQLQSQSPRIRKTLTPQQEIELKSHLCLLIAAKIEETDDIQGTSDRIPHCMMLKELRKASRYQFPREDYLREEGPTFNALGWSLMCITPFHFLHSLLSMGLLYEDDQVKLKSEQCNQYNSASSSSGGSSGKFFSSSSSVDTDKILERVKYHAESFLDQWLKHTWCTLYKKQRRYRPSVVALCCVLAARRAIGISPILSDRLKEMALIEECYDESVYQEIGDCFEVLCSLANPRGQKFNLIGGSSGLLLNDQGSESKKQQYLTATAPKQTLKSQVSTCDRTPKYDSAGIKVKKGGQQETPQTSAETGGLKKFESVLPITGDAINVVECTEISSFNNNETAPAMLDFGGEGNTDTKILGEDDYNPKGFVSQTTRVVSGYNHSKQSSIAKLASNTQSMISTALHDFQETLSLKKLPGLQLNQANKSRSPLKSVENPELAQQSAKPVATTQITLQLKPSCQLATGHQKIIQNQKASNGGAQRNQSRSKLGHNTQQDPKNANGVQQADISLNAYKDKTAATLNRAIVPTKPNVYSSVAPKGPLFTKMRNTSVTEYHQQVPAGKAPHFSKAQSTDVNRKNENEEKTDADQEEFHLKQACNQQRQPATKKMSLAGIPQLNTLTQRNGAALEQSSFAGTLMQPSMSHLSNLRKVLHVKHKSQTSFMNNQIGQNFSNSLAKAHAILNGTKTSDNGMTSDIGLMAPTYNQVIVEERCQSDLQILDEQGPKIMLGELKEPNAVTEEMNAFQELCGRRIKPLDKKKLLDGSSIVESLNELSFNEQIALIAPPLSATNKNAITMNFNKKASQVPQTGGVVVGLPFNQTATTFSLLNNYIMKSKSGIKATVKHQGSTKKILETSSDVMDKLEEIKSGRNQSNRPPIDEHQSSRVSLGGISSGSQSHREYGLTSAIQPSKSKRIVTSNFDFSHCDSRRLSKENSKVPQKQLQPIGEDIDCDPTNHMKQCCIQLQNEDRSPFNGKQQKGEGANQTSQLVYDAYLITNTGKGVENSQMSSSRNKFQWESQLGSSRSTNQMSGQISGRPAVIPKVAPQNIVNFHHVNLATEEANSIVSTLPDQEMELVAEKQGSARLFAAFKKNFTSIKKDIGYANSRQNEQKFHTQRLNFAGRTSQTRIAKEKERCETSNPSQALSSRKLQKAQESGEYMTARPLNTKDLNTLKVFSARSQKQQPAAVCIREETEADIEAPSSQESSNKSKRSSYQVSSNDSQTKHQQSLGHQVINSSATSEAQKASALPNLSQIKNHFGSTLKVSSGKYAAKTNALPSARAPFENKSMMKKTELNTMRTTTQEHASQGLTKSKKEIATMAQVEENAQQNDFVKMVGLFMSKHFNKPTKK